MTLTDDESVSETDWTAPTTRPSPRRTLTDVESVSETTEPVDESVSETDSTSVRVTSERGALW